MSFLNNLKTNLVEFGEVLGSKIADSGVIGESVASLYYRSRQLLYDKRWVEFEGFDLFIDPSEYVGENISRSTFHEEELRNMILEEVSEGDKVADIGAHIGSTTLIMRKAVGKEGEVLAYEPNPVNFEMLKKTVEENSLGNVETFQYALSDSNGDISLKHNDWNTGASSIRGSEHVSEVFEVEEKKASESLPLDTDWAKIDIEGTEYEVITDLEGNLQSFKGLFLEFHPSRLSENEIEELFHILDSEGVIRDFNGKKIDLENFRESMDQKDFIWKAEN